MIVKEYSITVDGTKSLEQLVTECNAEIIHPLEGIKFRIRKHEKREVNIALFHFDVVDMEECDVSSAMIASNYEPACEEEMMALIAKIGDIGDMKLFALSARSMDMDLESYVLKCEKFEDGNMIFNPKPTGKGWGPWVNRKCYFPAVRN